MIKTALVLFFALFLFQSSAVSAQKPEPPEPLAKLFSAVVELEDASGEGDWKKALKSHAEIESYLALMTPSVRKTAGNSAYQDLETMVAQLEKALNDKNMSATSMTLLGLQKVIFNTMAFYHYSVHPAFMVIQQYVEEALEAAGKKDFARVTHEMKEVASVVTVTAQVMEEKGVGKGMQTDLRSYLVSVVAAAEEKNQDLVLQSLKKMQLLAGAFVWMGAR